MREGRRKFWAAVVGVGITPACAGRTYIIVISHMPPQDHPRVCGKDRDFVVTPKYRVGSPPRVREGPKGYIVKNGTYRITPACAGRTFSYIIFVQRLKDHPRVCGKDAIGTAADTQDIGSPPRVREGLAI